MSSQTVYVVRGPVRGEISRHRIIAAAHKSQARDASACRSLGGGAYSDARIVAVEDGRERGLTDREILALDMADERDQF